jgi:hypothetical protein
VSSYGGRSHGRISNVHYSANSSAIEILCPDDESANEYAKQLVDGHESYFYLPVPEPGTVGVSVDPLGDVLM